MADRREGEIENEAQREAQPGTSHLWSVAVLQAAWMEQETGSRPLTTGVRVVFGGWQSGHRHPTQLSSWTTLAVDTTRCGCCN